MIQERARVNYTIPFDSFGEHVTEEEKQEYFRTIKAGVKGLYPDIDFVFAVGDEPKFWSQGLREDIYGSDHYRVCADVMKMAEFVFFKRNLSRKEDAWP